jgi:hypothetical protein
VEAVAKTAENQVDAAVPHSAGPRAAACVGLRAARVYAFECPQARALAQTAAAKAQAAEHAVSTSALGKQVAAVAKSAENQV